MKTNHSVRILGALFWVCLSLQVFAGDGVNPDAPSETAQYAFMLGAWDCATKSMRPDRSFVEGKAIWEGGLILSGWAIQDHWTSLGPDGKPTSFGTNIRSFNPKLKKWECRWLASGSLTWSEFLSWKEGETMVMEGSGRDQHGDFVDRNTFYNIQKDSWSWRKDRSYDGGKTWLKGVSFIEARRRK